MSKNRNYHIKYSILVNGEEYAREYTVKGVKNEGEATTKLSTLCNVDITVTHIEEVIWKI